MFTCFDVANFFINLANETGSYISNLKLQKLVYYAQAWYLALYNDSLFPEDFQAWIHGLVIPVLYAKYKVFQWQPIILEEVEKPNFPQNIADFLAEIIDDFPELTEEDIRSCLEFAADRDHRLVTLVSAKVEN